MPNVPTGTSTQIIVVLPGDDVSSFVPSDKKIRLGMGLERMETPITSTTPSALDAPPRIVATLAGRLHHHRDTWFVWTNSKRYQPQPEDRVVGIVQDRMGSEGGADVYRVDVGAPHTCSLSSLQFEGATKRNRPIFTTGTLLYTRVVSGSQVTDPVLSCQLGPKDQGIARKDWMTEEAAYGELKGGTLQKVPLGLARELLSPQSVVLEELSKLPFEIAVGVNGYLWIHAARTEYTILVRNAILNSQVLTPEQTRAMVRTLMETVKRQMEEDDESDNEEEADDIQEEQE
jgi:exosome complex component RRP40